MTVEIVHEGMGPSQDGPLDLKSDTHSAVRHVTDCATQPNELT